MTNGAQPRPWWKGAVIYQVYPRSYQDSNGDGVGDLAGLISRLPYIASLGVDGVWISPFFKSPQRDFGYDVSDYRAVDPLFGSDADFDTLLARAHELGLKIIIDLVLSHTSIDHPWFRDSRARLNHKDDWYVWAEPKDDGSPPNNWVAMFGGPAWTFDPLRGQYYMHNFLKEQPDLNMHSPAVQDAALDIMRYWLEKGVDGFRLDVVNYYCHDKHLRSNPVRPASLGAAHQFTVREPYNMQRHLYDKSQPENLAFIERMRALTDEYDARMMVGEIGDDDPVACAATYTSGDNRLHTAYSFAFMNSTGGQLLSSELIRNALTAENAAGNGSSWPSWAFSNHDVTRSVTRFGRDIADKRAYAKLMIALLCSLRGTAFMYQGEELGLTDVVIPFDKLQDPWGKNIYPVWQGRDGCRTPMPWDHTAPHAGFSQAEPWLPVANEHLDLSVARQEADDASPLAFARNFLAWRKTQDDLIDGDMHFLDTPEGALAFRRGETLCIFNLTGQDMPVQAGGVSVVLGPFEFSFARMGG